MVELRIVLLVSLLLSTVVVASALGYWVGMSQSNRYAESVTPQVVRENVTVYGAVAGIPCSSLRLPCPTPANQSLSVKLIKYAGNYYYLSDFTIINNQTRTVYTIWFDNSTYYCISPKVEWAKTCP